MLCMPGLAEVLTSASPLSILLLCSWAHQHVAYGHVKVIAGKYVLHEDATHEMEEMMRASVVANPYRR